MNDPYNEGRTIDRTKEHENPYPPGSVAWNQWEDGYEDAIRECNSKWIDETGMNEIIEFFGKL